MIGIYKITSPTGKVYIGQSWNIAKRKREHKSAANKRQHKLYNSIIKHGWSQHHFKIIHELPSDIEQGILDGYEQLYMDLYRDAGTQLLNLREAGGNGKPSLETKLKQSLSMKGRPSKLKGVPKSKESIAKAVEARKRNGNMGYGKVPWNKDMKGQYSTSRKGVPTSKESILKGVQTKIKNGTTGKGISKSEETKKRIGDAQRGDKNHMYGKPAWNKGISPSDETKAKLRESLKGNVPWNKGKEHSEQHKLNLKKAWAKRRLNKNV